jgi:hypothetical protein
MSTLLARVLNVCKELKVSCQLSGSRGAARSVQNSGGRGAAVAGGLPPVAVSASARVTQPPPIAL